VNSVAIVTGASPGIGRSTAIRLARDFSAIALAARNADELSEEQMHLRSHLVAGRDRNAGGCGLHSSEARALQEASQIGKQVTSDMVTLNIRECLMRNPCYI